MEDRTKQQFVPTNNISKTAVNSVLSLDNGRVLVPNAKQLLYRLFTKIAKKFHLEKIFTSRDISKVCCSAGEETRRVLFGSAVLEVFLTTTVVSSSIVKTDLLWHHPYNNPEAGGTPSQEETHAIYQKRARFIQLFNSTWQHMLDKIRPFLSIEEYNDELDNKENLMVSQRSGGKKLFSSPESNTSKFVPVIVQHDNTETINLQSSLKLPRSNSSTERKGLRVTFLGDDRFREFPLTKENREARMSLGASATLPCGNLKPLREVKTGLYKNYNENSAVIDLTNTFENDLSTSTSTNSTNSHEKDHNLPPKKRMLKRRDSPKRFRIDY